MRCFKVLFSSKPGADGPGCLERSQHPPGMVNGIRVPGAGSEHCFVPCCLRAPLGGGACVECGLQDTVSHPETGSSAPESCQAGQGVLLTSLPSFGRLPPPRATLLLQPGNDPAAQCTGFAQPAPGRRHLPRCPGTHTPSRVCPGISYRSCTVFKGLAWMGTPGSAWPCSHQGLRGRHGRKGFELSWKGLTHSGIQLLTTAGFL